MDVAETRPCAAGTAAWRLVRHPAAAAAQAKDRAAAGPAADPSGAAAAGGDPAAEDASGEGGLVAGAVAVDGKTLRGGIGPDRRQVHLLVALDQAHGAVLAQ